MGITEEIKNATNPTYVDHKRIFVENSAEGSFCLYLEKTNPKLSYSSPSQVGTVQDYAWEIKWGDASFSETDPTILTSTEAKPKVYFSGYRPVHVALTATSAVGTGKSEAVLALKTTSGLLPELPPMAPAGSFRLYDADGNSVGWSRLMNKLLKFYDYTKNITSSLWVHNDTGEAIPFGTLLECGDIIDTGVSPIVTKIPKVLRKFRSTYYVPDDFDSKTTIMGVLVMASSDNIGDGVVTELADGENGLLLIVGIYPFDFDTQMALDSGQIIHGSKTRGKIEMTGQYGSNVLIGAEMSVSDEGVIVFDMSSMRQRFAQSYSILSGDWQNTLNDADTYLEFSYFPIEESIANKSKRLRVFVPNRTDHVIEEYNSGDLSTLITTYPLPDVDNHDLSYIAHSGELAIGDALFEVSNKSLALTPRVKIWSGIPPFPFDVSVGNKVPTADVTELLHGRFYAYDDSNYAGIIAGKDGGDDWAIWTNPGSLTGAFTNKRNVIAGGYFQYPNCVQCAHDGTYHYHVAVEYKAGVAATVHYNKCADPAAPDWQVFTLQGHDSQTYDGLAGIVRDEQNPGLFWLFCYRDTLADIPGRSYLAEIIKLDMRQTVITPVSVGFVKSDYPWQTTPDWLTWLNYQDGDKIGAGFNCGLTGVMLMDRLREMTSYTDILGLALIGTGNSATFVTCLTEPSGFVKAIMGVVGGGYSYFELDI